MGFRKIVFMNRFNERRKRKSLRAGSENFEDGKNINDITIIQF